MTTETTLDVETLRRFCADVDELCKYLTVVGISQLMRRIQGDLPGLLDRMEQTEQERNELLSAEHASVLVADRDTYKSGYEAKTVLVHEMVAALAAVVAERDVLRQQLAAATEREASMRKIVENLVAIGQRQPDAIILSTLGFDMHNAKWRFGFNGWERQAEESQAGCFPATDWIDEMLGPALAAQEPQPSRTVCSVCNGSGWEDHDDPSGGTFGEVCSYCSGGGTEPTSQDQQP